MPSISTTPSSTRAPDPIPPRPQRPRQHRYDTELYKERDLVERFFNKLKHFRRIATCYDKLIANFLGFVTLGSIHLLLR